MSLLALMADKFELEPQDSDRDADFDDELVRQLNNSSVVANDMADKDNIYSQALQRIMTHAAAAITKQKAGDGEIQHHHDGVSSLSLRQLLADDDDDDHKPHHHQHHRQHPRSRNKHHLSSSADSNEASFEVTNYHRLDDSSSRSGSDARSHHHKQINHQNDDMKLLISFLLMVIVGTGSKVYQKLGAIPMYNYPNSLNLLQNFIYVPLCFAYILPVSAFGLLRNAIPPNVSSMNKRPFAIMGFYDCLTGILLTFAAVYLPGSLLILLPQAAIPISMILSKHIKGERYSSYQIWGAFVVVLGIIVVLEPLITQRHAADYTCVAYNEEQFCSICAEEFTEEGCLSHRTIEDSSSTNSNIIENDDDKNDSDGTSGPGHHDIIYFLSSVLAQDDNSSSSSHIPNDNDHDGMVCQWTPSKSEQGTSSGTTTNTILLWSVMTILACIPMTLSSIYKEMTLTGANSIDPIFLNGWVAIFQFFFSLGLSVPAGMTSHPPIMPQDLPNNIIDGLKCYIGISTISSGCHPDDKCFQAPHYVNVYFLFNVCFNILVIFVLKFGSANVLVMASTVMVPIGNLVFALPFMPGSTPLKDSDIAGLIVILLGLVLYRFGNTLRCGMGCYGRWSSRADKEFEWDAPILDYNDDNNMSIDHRGALSMLEKPLLTPIE